MDDLVRLVERLRERSQSINHEAADAIEQLQRQLAEAVQALETINRKASPDPERTMSEASNDLYWCACESRRALAHLQGEPK